MNPEEIKKLTDWLQTQSKSLPYGELSINCIFHNGKLKRVIKTVSESELQN